MVLHDGRYTSFQRQIVPGGIRVEIEPLVHPPNLDIQIVRMIIDSIQSINAVSEHGVIVTIAPRPAAQSSEEN